MPQPLQNRAVRESLGFSPGCSRDGQQCVHLVHYTRAEDQGNACCQQQTGPRCRQLSPDRSSPHLLRRLQPLQGGAPADQRRLANAQSLVWRQSLPLWRQSLVWRRPQHGKSHCGISPLEIHNNLVVISSENPIIYTMNLESEFEFVELVAKSDDFVPRSTLRKKSKMNRPTVNSLWI